MASSDTTMPDCPNCFVTMTRSFNGWLLCDSCDRGFLFAADALNLPRRSVLQRIRATIRTHAGKTR